jgi:predicted dithiol-disulfide oxidoreductase (DUF899 family)
VASRARGAARAGEGAHPRAWRDGDEVYRTYFVDARGDEALGSAWSFLDITPYGRQEEWEDSPEGWPQTPPYTWASWHDKYDRAL